MWIRKLVATLAELVGDTCSTLLERGRNSTARMLVVWTGGMRIRTK
jgi:hypothetical protein